MRQPSPSAQRFPISLISVFQSLTPLGVMGIVNLIGAFGGFSPLIIPLNWAFPSTVSVVVAVSGPVTLALVASRSPVTLALPAFRELVTLALVAVNFPEPVRSRSPLTFALLFTLSA